MRVCQSELDLRWDHVERVSHADYGFTHHQRF